MLDECCSSGGFPSELYSACNSQGAAQDEPACNAALQGYSSYCGSDGTSAGSGGTLTASCMSLASCCTTAGIGDLAVAQCYSTMGANDPSMCNAAMSSLCGGGGGDDSSDGDAGTEGEDSGF
jgi:hypothetical protein